MDNVYIGNYNIQAGDWITRTEEGKPEGREQHRRDPVLNLIGGAKRKRPANLQKLETGKPLPPLLDTIQQEEYRNITYRIILPTGKAPDQQERNESRNENGPQKQKPHLPTQEYKPTGTKKAYRSMETTWTTRHAENGKQAASFQHQHQRKHQHEKHERTKRNTITTKKPERKEGENHIGKGKDISSRRV